jgi:antitoxin (DNA-binding transcriptional repressor) of toxin-antitoxin stability system
MIEVQVVRCTRDVYKPSTGQTLGHCPEDVGLEEPFARSDDQRWTLDALPFLPIVTADPLAQGAHHHLSIEARPPSAFPVLQPIGPGTGVQRSALEEEHCCLTRGKRRWPLLKPLANPFGTGSGWICVRASLRYNQPVDEIGMARRYEKREIPAERLADQDDRAQIKLFDHERDIGHVRLARDILGCTRAPPVASLVKCQNSMVPCEPGGRLAPLASVTGEPVQQQHGRAVPTEVQTSQPYALPLEGQPLRVLRCRETARRHIASMPWGEPHGARSVAHASTDCAAPCLPLTMSCQRWKVVRHACYTSPMAREITQRQLRNESGEIMRDLDRGESFVVTRNGVPVGALTPAHRHRFVPAAVAIEAFSGLPPIDYAEFRSDVDRWVDQDPTPRA